MPQSEPGDGETDTKGQSHGGRSGEAGEEGLDVPVHEHSSTTASVPPRALLEAPRRALKLTSLVQVDAKFCTQQDESAFDHLKRHRRSARVESESGTHEGSHLA